MISTLVAVATAVKLSDRAWYRRMSWGRYLDLLAGRISPTDDPRIVLAFRISHIGSVLLVILSWFFPTLFVGWVAFILGASVDAAGARP